MKKTLLTFLLAFFVCLFNTNAQTPNETIAYVSPQKDTLLLPNDNLGKLIASTWLSTPITQSPIILFSDEDIIKHKNEMLFNTRNKKKLIKK